MSLSTRAYRVKEYERETTDGAMRHFIHSIDLKRDAIQHGHLEAVDGDFFGSLESHGTLGPRVRPRVIHNEVVEQLCLLQNLGMALLLRLRLRRLLVAVAVGRAPGGLRARFALIGRLLRLHGAR